MRAGSESPLAERVILAFATAGEVSTGMAQVVTIWRQDSCAARVEWWAPSADANSLELQTANGRSGGEREAFPLGTAGALVVRGPQCESEIEAVLDRLAPILRRRLAEEQLGGETAPAARRHQALRGLSSLPAPRLRSPPQAVLLGQPYTVRV